jgi:hypothetical protein
MFNSFVKFYNFSSLPTCSRTCWEGREVVEFDESIEHVEREEKL